MLFTRVYAFIALLGLTLSIGFWGGGELIKEFRYGFTALFTGINSHNLLRLKWDSAVEEATRLMSSSSSPGLPVVRLYIPEKSQKQLLSNVFDSTKEWQNAFQLFPDKRLHSVRVRHQGDNPYNWGFDKKSWRVKTKKQDLLNGQRYRDYRIPQSSYLLANHLALWFSKSLDLPSANSRMVELVINEKSFGVYQELERLDESFLRRNSIMPVNLYKGEQVHIEKTMRRSIDLFDNPDLWKKTAIFNQLPENDNLDLAQFLDLLREAMTSKSAWDRFSRLAPIDEWAKMATLAVLTQSYHNDDVHNMRLLSDPWKGTITPIPNDVGAFFNRSRYFIDFAPHPLWKLYMTSSQFLWKRDQLLYNALNNSALLTEAQKVVKLFGPKLQNSYSRAPHRVQWMERSLNYDQIKNTVMSLSNELNEVTENIGTLDKWLRSRLWSSPNSSWKQLNNGLQIVVAGSVPLNKVQILFPENATYPSRIVWDADFNGRLSKDDFEIPFVRIKGGIQLDAVWLANRVQVGKVRINQVATAFNIFANIPLNISSIKGANALTGIKYDLSRNNNFNGATPARLNHPLVEPTPSQTLNWPQNVTIDKNTIIKSPVVIKAGSVIRMRSGVSLIFRDQVTINGTPKSKVRIIGENEDDIWGTVALVGPGTSGSRISNLSISGGSGATVDNIRFVGMLSLHNVNGVNFDFLELSENNYFDDMMHIIYSNNIQLSEPHFTGAISDALDIDVSQNIRIVNGIIENSGNDAIDLMSSKAILADMNLSGSGDKGISVGEASSILVLDSIINDNKVGVEVKDNSVSFIGYSNFYNNKKPVNAYAKNWRYGSGGNVHIDKVLFQGPVNTLGTDKSSKIKITDSAFISGCPKTHTQLFLGPNVDCQFVSETKNTKLDPYLEDAVKSWGRRPSALQRGVPN